MCQLGQFPSTHNCHYTTDDFTLTVTTNDGTVLYNGVVEWKEQTTRNPTASLLANTSSYLGPVLFILLIILSIFVGSTFRGTDEASTSGFTTFLLGSIGLAFLTNAFIAPAIVAAIYYAGQYLYKTAGS